MTIEEAIKQAVLKKFNLKLDDIITKSDNGRWLRNTEQSLARHIMYYLYRRVYGMPCSLKSVPKMLLGIEQDHATVIHGINKVENLLEWDKTYPPILEAIKAEIDITMMFTNSVQANEVADKIKHLQDQISILSHPFNNCASL